MRWCGLRDFVRLDRHPSPIWCNVVKMLGTPVEDSTERWETMKRRGGAAVRSSISFPPGVYATLEVIAKEKKVSLAWVVREAVEKYIADKWPLFKEHG